MLVLTWLKQRSIRLRVISMYADARQLSIVHVRPRIPGKGKEKGALSIARMGLRRKQYCWEPGRQLLMSITKVKALRMHRWIVLCFAKPASRWQTRRNLKITLSMSSLGVTRIHDEMQTSQVKCILTARTPDHRTVL